MSGRHCCKVLIENISLVHLVIYIPETTTGCGHDASFFAKIKLYNSAQKHGLCRDNGVKIMKPALPVFQTANR